MSVDVLENDLGQKQHLLLSLESVERRKKERWAAEEMSIYGGRGTFPERKKDLEKKTGKICQTVNFDSVGSRGRKSVGNQREGARFRGTSE